MSSYAPASISATLRMFLGESLSQDGLISQPRLRGKDEENSVKPGSEVEKREGGDTTSD